MPALRHEDFAAFFEEIHGVAPFDWQQRLATQVMSTGTWPEVIDVPTGAGKTSCIDVALFCLAASATAPTAERHPRRIILVVDRRVVVDQAHERGIKLECALSHTQPGSVAERVAQALRLISGDPERPPVKATVLRGAMPRDDNWAHTPTQPLIISSTVDQVGSRLLFRGYGVSNSMRPVHAGLLGSDCLYLLDEVHLSQPFMETLRALQSVSDRLEVPLTRFGVVSLSATPGDSGTQTRFGLTEKDSSGALLQRLDASKPAELAECDANEVALTFSNAALRLSEKHSRVLVVVNRVERALNIARTLLAETATTATGVTRPRITLLTGRMRPITRDQITKELTTRVGSGCPRDAAQPEIVVATQCIEAGADFDFDALVTELAGFDALRQRFGRVNRLGLAAESQSLIYAVKEEQDSGKLEISKEDPVYGTALRNCKKLLEAIRDAAPVEQSTKKKRKNVSVNFGINSMNAALSQEAVKPFIPAASATRLKAPPLFPGYLDLWSQTAPVPDWEPEIAQFLHGIQKPQRTASIVWRRDIGGQTEETVTERLEAIPPTTLEAAQVPLHAVATWLFDQKAQSSSDLEGREDLVFDDGSSLNAGLADCFIWDGRDAKKLQSVKDLRSNVTIIVPCSRGGLFLDSFDASCTGVEVDDVAELAFARARGRKVLRLQSWDASDEAPPPKSAPAHIRQLWEQFSTGLRHRNLGDDEWQVLLARELDSEPESPEASTEDEDSSLLGRAVSLRQHSHDVEAFATRFATGVLGDAPEAAAVTFAGWLHDVGKADPRFQQAFRDGSLVQLEMDRNKLGDDWVLAKSALTRYETRRDTRARRVSGYPPGTRHEALSLAMCSDDVVCAEAGRRGVKDFELVLFLIASHHGHARPFFRPAVDAAPVIVNLKHGDLQLAASTDHQLYRYSAGTAERFTGLVNRYGWHRLALMEALVRLADHRASEMEARS